MPRIWMNLARRSSSVRMGGPLIGCFTVAGAAAATASAPFLAAVPKTPANRVWAGDGVPALELLSHCGAASSAMRGVEAGLSTRRAAWSELGARLAIGWRDCDARCCPACDVRCGRRWGEGLPDSLPGAARLFAGGGCAGRLAVPLEFCDSSEQLNRSEAGSASLPACCIYIMLRKNASDWPMGADSSRKSRKLPKLEFIFA
jgi:hypothetical protein